MIPNDLAEIINLLISFVMLRPIILLNLIFNSCWHLNMVWKCSLCLSFGNSMDFLRALAFRTELRKATTEWLWLNLLEILTTLGACWVKSIRRGSCCIYLSAVSMKRASCIACMSDIRIKVWRGATKSLWFHNFLIFLIVLIRLRIFLLRSLIWY